MYKLLLISIFSFLFLNSFSQGFIRGKVLNYVTQAPIAYVNIGIPGSSVGTVSNEDGTFSISIPDKNYPDTIYFSALGFTTRQIAVPSLISKSNLVVTLREKITTLEGIVVTAKKEKNKTFWLGNRYTKGGFLYADSLSAGAAMALLIDNKYPSLYADLRFPIYLEEVSAYINKNSLPSFKIRVRILEYDSMSGQPGRDLLAQSVVINSSLKKGWLKIDLRPYYLQVRQRFFLVLEWIMEDRDRLALLNEYAMYRKENPEKVSRDSLIVDGKKIGFWSYDDFRPGTHLGVSPIPFSLQNYTCYYRTNSFGEWKRSPVILTARVLVSNQPSSSGSTPLSLPPTLSPISETEERCNNFLLETAVNGFQLAVLKNGKMAFTKGYGYADIQKGLAVTTSTRFRIGSISKSVTSAALVKLTKEGKLDIDAPIGKYLPVFPYFKYPVTTRQLAGHLAGVRHYRDGDINDLIRYDRYASSTDALKIIEKDTLLFKPGEKFLYSSFGWNIIGALVERVSGRHYLEYMQENIWKPLGLKHISGAVKDSVSSDYSKGYLATGEEFGSEDLSYKYPSGGLISNSEDLAVFGNKMLDDMQNFGAVQLFNTMHLNNGDVTNYGIGWNIGKDASGHRIFFHTGNMMNGSGFLVLYPDDKIVIAFLCNGPEGLSFDIHSIAECFYRQVR